jgi:hypothetical protein
MTSPTAGAGPRLAEPVITGARFKVAAQAKLQIVRGDVIEGESCISCVGRLIE